jgi:hypothetical protein
MAFLHTDLAVTRQTPSADNLDPSSGYGQPKMELASS